MGNWQVDHSPPKRPGIEIRRLGFVGETVEMVIVR